MQPKRISLKFYASAALEWELSRLVPIFQRWIQQSSVEGVLVDVADYQHVPEGPGILLIGHQGDYSVAVQDGRAALIYTRKWELAPTLPETLALIFRLALDATQQLKAETTLPGLAWDYQTVDITLIDRLHTPNTPETFAALRAEIEGFVAALYGTDAFTLTPIGRDAREALTIRVQVATPTSGEILRERLASLTPALDGVR